MPQLTPIQRQILEHLLAGKPNKEIARELKLAVQTVKNEMRDVLSYFGITRTRQLLPIIDRVKLESCGIRQNEDSEHATADERADQC